ncbi:phage head completion protein [Gorillibacterium sp. sgz5001074]|uniref:phage head completion protein n=1 Tax=Gorillibacterium sp. sgz5001074 TaxID=3446695 RepID=UPI003F673137
MSGMLRQRCAVKRYTMQKDEYNTPMEQEWVMVASIPCQLSRKTIRVVQEAPENRSEVVYMLYFPTRADIQSGDLVEIAGMGTYKAAIPYRHGGPYGEVQVEWEGPI